MAAILSKGLSYFAKVLSFCMKIPGIIHPIQHLFMAVNLIGYGSVPIVQSVFYLLRNPWEALGWQVNTIDADVKQVITSWLQTLNNSDFTREYKPWYHCGGKCEYGSGNYIEVWCVPSAWRVPYIDQSHNNVLTWERMLPYCLTVLCIYILLWVREFINTGCFEWWGYCVIGW
jgi:hypothetical protein